jgi:SAM-dependent methyltransferase
VDPRRTAVPFDPYHFEKLAREGVTPAPEAVFRDIYQRHHWTGSESASGAGAAPDQIQHLRTALPALLARLGVGTLLDLPCGDYSWMRTLELPVARYIGADLLPELIEPLASEHADAGHEFRVLDLTRDPLPAADLLLCRDCLVHLSYADIRRALANIARSGIPYLLTTTFPTTAENEDIVTGDWRVLNLERPPFGFPPPVELLNEHCTEGEGRFGDKSLGLWRVAELRIAESGD